jgi:hypothetical protein
MALLLWAGGVAGFAILALIWHDPNPGWASTHYWGGLPRMLLSFYGGALLFQLHRRIIASIPQVSPALIATAFVAMQLLTIRHIAWPLLGLGVPLLIAVAATSQLPRGSLALCAWAERNALMIYLLCYPTITCWRAVPRLHPQPISTVGIGFDLFLVASTLLLIVTALNKTVLRMTKL